MSDERTKELEARIARLERSMELVVRTFGLREPAGPGDQPAAPLPKPDVERCAEMWVGTLEKFGIKRPILPHENMKIFQLLKGYGVTAVLYALYGMRFEQGTASFDPAKNVSLTRIQDPKLFEKMLNLGCRQREIEKRKR